MIELSGSCDLFECHTRNADDDYYYERPDLMNWKWALGRSNPQPEEGLLAELIVRFWRRYKLIH